MKPQFLIILYLVVCLSASAMPPNCEFYEDGLVLHCYCSSDIPEGSFCNVEVVNFSNNNFTRLNRNVFYNNGFQKLKKAVLRSNHITEIEPKAFASASGISVLDLSRNKLTEFTKNTFNGLTTLKILNLASNHIISIDAEILEPLTYLDSLDLSNNSITNLPVDLLKYGSITQLDASGNPLAVPESGPVLESSFLTQLFLKSCNLEKLPQDAFSKLEKLQILDLSDNQLKVIPTGSLKGLTRLKYLDISYNFIVHLEDLFSPIAALKQFSCEGNIIEADKCNSFIATISGDVSSSTTVLTMQSEHTNTDFVDIGTHSKVYVGDILALMFIGISAFVLLLIFNCEARYILPITMWS